MGSAVRHLCYNRRSCPVDLQFLYPCRGYFDFSQKFATQWLISVRSFQRSEGDVCDQIKNIYSWSVCIYCI